MSVEKKTSEIRDYVEKELARTVRNYPDLKVTKITAGKWQDTSRALYSVLSWRIEGPSDPWQVDYVVEARVEDGELLIWFGYHSGGIGGTHLLMRPAVHISIQDLFFAATQYGQSADVFSLGAVLDLMLRLRSNGAGWLRFPMNNYALT